MSRDELWSTEELRAAVSAYVHLLVMQSEGRLANKSEINRQLVLGALKRRTKASVEYRMQNISTLVERLGLESVKGYLPAKQVGTNVAATIQKLLLEELAFGPLDASPTQDRITLEKRVQSLLNSGLSVKPKGQARPQKRTVEVWVYERDPGVIAWALKRANGICEACGRVGPFITKEKTVFLEVHHLQALGQGGPDTPENTAALCPNCHREAHNGLHFEQIRENVMKKRLTEEVQVVPRIAILGWGSLLWDGRKEFNSQIYNWELNGPSLQLQFSRISISREGALTLVIDLDNGASCMVAWALSKRTSVKEAIDDMHNREGGDLSSIKSLRIGGSSGRLKSTEAAISSWAKVLGLDYVVWTGLKSNFLARTGVPFSEDEAIKYLKSREGIQLEKAAEYVWKAPNFIKLRLRDRLQEELWFARPVDLGVRT